MKIAVIGTGIAGLAAAYRLSSTREHHVTLFDAVPQLGFASHTIGIDYGSHPTLVGDLPSRMFNPAVWPNLVNLYREIGVEYSEVRPTQSFSRQVSRKPDKLKSEIFLKNTMQTSFGINCLRKRTRTILRDARRLKVQGKRDLDEGIHCNQTLKDYLGHRGYTDTFKRSFLYPVLSSTVCTCSYRSLDGYPAAIILSALDGLTDNGPLYRLRYSARDVAERLTRWVDRTRLNCRVQEIQPEHDSVRISLPGDREESFDYVIVATQANTVRRLVTGMHSSVYRFLDSVQYENVTVAIHRDPSFLPSRKRNWSMFNMVSDHSQQAAMCTVWMNDFHDDWWPAPDVFQTINPIRTPDQVISNVQLQRCVVTPSSQRVIANYSARQLSRSNRILFAGSWAAPGIPLLESGVKSAWSACEAITKHATSISLRPATAAS